MKKVLFTCLLGSVLSCTDHRFDLSASQKIATNITNEIAIEIDTAHSLIDSTNFARLIKERGDLFVKDCNNRYFYVFPKDSVYSEDSVKQYTYTKYYTSRAENSSLEYLYLRIGTQIVEDSFLDSIPASACNKVKDNVIYGRIVNYCDSCCD